MIRFIAKVIYFIVGIGMIAELIHLAWLRESSDLILTPAILFAILAVLLSYFVIGCNLWEEKVGRAYIYPERWLEEKEQE